MLCPLCGHNHTVYLLRRNMLALLLLNLIFPDFLLRHAPCAQNRSGNAPVPLFSLTNLFQLPQNQCGILLCKYLPLPESLRQTCHLKMPRSPSHFFRYADHTDKDNADHPDLISSRSDIRNLLRNPQVHAQNLR